MKRNEVDLPARITLSKTQSSQGYGGLGDTVLSSSDQKSENSSDVPTVEQLLDNASVTGKLLREIQH